jgi:hypothetical protein
MIDLPKIIVVPLGEEGMCSHHPSTGGPHFWLKAITEDNRAQIIYCKHCNTQTLTMYSGPKA